MLAPMGAPLELEARSMRGQVLDDLDNLHVAGVLFVGHSVFRNRFPLFGIML
ncbi:hypothetical protein [Pseudaminobacter salicylatoxidans]|uniref:hypothetical protein n=1 Tax=Pseudaminobacter salicylatoxidans TaxID=93369 RepID=UPI0002EFFF20|nr:hypothetical protein [Pseudaminobacter salicylatoxidans]